MILAYNKFDTEIEIFACNVNRFIAEFFVEVSQILLHLPLIRLMKVGPLDYPERAPKSWGLFFVRISP